MIPQPVQQWDSGREWKTRAWGYVLQLAELTAAEKVALQKLLDLAEESGARSLPALIVTSATVIAAAIGKSERSVQRAIQSLQAKGYIRRKDTLRGRGLYEIDDPADAPRRLGVVRPSPQGELFFAGDVASVLSSELTPPPTADVVQVLTTKVTPSGPRIAGGETPRTHAQAQDDRTDEFKPSSTIGDDDVCEEGKRLVKAFWPQGRGPINHRADQRLLYRLAVLGLAADYAQWVKALTEATADRRAERPLAWLQSVLPDFAPDGIRPGRLLASIPVPSWALCDPRRWKREGESLEAETIGAPGDAPPPDAGRQEKPAENLECLIEICKRAKSQAVMRAATGREPQL
jgi:hypothetical protein